MKISNAKFLISNQCFNEKMSNLDSVFCFWGKKRVVIPSPFDKLRINFIEGSLKKLEKGISPLVAPRSRSK